MSLIEKVKNLFGFAPAEHHSSVEPTTDLPQNNESALITPKPTPAGPPPAAQQRERVIRLIVGRLRVYQNEPETAPVGLRLSILATDPEEEELYRVALWENQPGKFQNELNRQLADNYITLPKNWRFDYSFFSDELPESSYREGNLALAIADKSKPTSAPLRASIVALVGQTEQADYVLDPAQKTTYYIGRGHTTQTTSGRVRTNDIVILNEDDPGFDPQKGSGNGAVSRSHATIRYDMTLQRYALLVDAGGLPASGNKTKIMHPDDRIERADIANLVYPLQDGDQIELGGEVMLLFKLA
ncbi:FHA domain-containing protein [Spirosoma sp. HMF4905]|uniref:FHA domain-containing protein n=1 Tax=Spirosoma arboris TaxID=2682092 RepID=A0A7K1SBR6_9BACT|nr:FHA domain-containing protein [Spirosoma arboris]MVM31215.1 FHA domain-containing protein [Spirosoma arboris]